MTKFSLEICAYSAESVSRAAKAGANRVELCAGRLEGGTTPSKGLLSSALKFKSIEVYPILRPRGGDFCYTEAEFEEMLIDLKLFRELGMPGFVTGILLPNGQFDMSRMEVLKQEAGDMDFCVHRAIDMCSNSLQSFEELIELGVKRVLSSGRKNTAIEGIDNLEQMQHLFGNRIEIMAGSGVNENNVEALWNAGIRHFHASALGNEPSPMTNKNTDIRMGKEGDVDEFARYHADVTKMEALKKVLLKCAS
jgi:copper homeostasis protein